MLNILFEISMAVTTTVVVELTIVQLVVLVGDTSIRCETGRRKKEKANQELRKTIEGSGRVALAQRLSKRKLEMLLLLL